MANCRGCGAVIRFVKSAKGKPIPCDPALIAYKYSTTDPDVTVVTPGGDVIKAKQVYSRKEADGVGYISHFATCPEAKNFRRSK